MLAYLIYILVYLIYSQRKYVCIGSTYQRLRTRYVHMIILCVRTEGIRVEVEAGVGVGGGVVEVEEG